ncbi:MAG: BON domain-containing protein, partial [Candidatus Binataceae bacterium]
ALPSPGPTPELAAVPSVVPTPMAAPPPAIAKRPERPRHEIASARPRRPSIPPLIDRVKDELRANRRFRRVQAYTKGGTVTLFGKAFDDQDKAAAQREVASVSGVTSVINNIVTDTSQWTYYQNQINSELRNAGFNQVSAKVIGKDCYLNGQVTSDLDRQRAVTIAERAAPVTVRVNLIRVVPGSMF